MTEKRLLQVGDMLPSEYQRGVTKMTTIKMDTYLKQTYCSLIPVRKDLLLVDECPNCHAFFGAIRRIKENTTSVNVKCGNCVEAVI